MPRRGDPENIYHAQRAGIFMRLVSEARLDRFDAEHWIARWEREAAVVGTDRGSPLFWDLASDWISEQRDRR